MVIHDTPAFTYRYNEKPIYTTSNGAPVNNPEGWHRTGLMGPLLLQDFHLIDALAHFDRMSASPFQVYVV
jgi:catalase